MISARKADALLLSPPESLGRPVRLFVETLAEMLRPTAAIAGAHVRLLDLRPEQRTGERLAQRAERKVRPLRQASTRAGSGSRMVPAPAADTGGAEQAHLPVPEGPLRIFAPAQA